MANIDYEEAVNIIKLDDEAFCHAIEAATESNVAGDDNQKQLETAIKVYMHCIIMKATKRND